MASEFPTEDALINTAVDRLAPLGLEVFLGVPCLSRCIDMVIVQGTLPVAIEFKLHDWRRGIDQAAEHRLAVDRTYVCLPPRKVSAAMKEAFAESGVGLLFLGGSEWPFQEVCPAKGSEVKWPIAEAWLRDSLQARRQQNGEVVLR